MYGLRPSFVELLIRRHRHRPKSCSSDGFFWPGPGACSLRADVARERAQQLWGHERSSSRGGELVGNPRAGERRATDAASVALPCRARRSPTKVLRDYQGTSAGCPPCCRGGGVPGDPPSSPHGAFQQRCARRCATAQGLIPRPPRVIASNRVGNTVLSTVHLVASTCPSRRRHAKSSHAHHSISCANVQLARVLGRHSAGGGLGGAGTRAAADRPSRERGPVSRRDRGAPVSHIEKKGGRGSRSWSLDVRRSPVPRRVAGRRSARTKAKSADVRGRISPHRISDNPNNCALGVVRMIG
jgi:hypothetical protein